MFIEGLWETEFVCSRISRIYLER